MGTGEKKPKKKLCSVSKTCPTKNKLPFPSQPRSSRHGGSLSRSLSSALHPPPTLSTLKKRMTQLRQVNPYLSVSK